MIRFALWLSLAWAVAGSALAQEAPLDAQASSLKFIGHAFMHDFNGECRGFSGSAQINPSVAELVTGATVTFPVAGMTTFEKSRDKNMRTWLEAGANPEIVFVLSKVKAFSGEPQLATEQSPVRFTVQGELQMHQHSHAINGMADGWRSGNTIVVTGTTSIDTSDYGLPQMRQFFLTVDKKVDIEYRLVFDLPPMTPVTIVR